MNAPTTVAALRNTGAMAERPAQKTIFHFLDDPRVKSGLGAVAGKFLDAERMLKLCINAVKKTPLLLQCDPQTVLGAMMTSAALGLEPNTIQQQAFLIPYKKRAQVDGKWVDVYECQFQIGARGFITLAYRSPHIKSIAAEAIHDGDRFEHMLGSETFLRYAKGLRERGALIGAFSHVRLADGMESACVLPLEEIHKIRGKSETYRALVGQVENASTSKDREKAARKLEETPWVMWEDDMAAKSAIKKHSKQLPISSGDALMAAAEIDNKGEIGAVDLKAMANPELVREVMAEGMELPALASDASDTLDTSSEAFGAVARQQEAAPAPAAPPAQAPAQQRHQPVAFDVAAFKQRLTTCTSQDTLDLMADEVSGLHRDQVIDDEVASDLIHTYRERKRSLQDAAEAGQQQAAQHQPAAQQHAQPAATTRRRAAGTSGQQSIE